MINRFGGAAGQARPVLRRVGTLGFTVYRPAATYFATTDIESVAPGLGHDFCRALPQRCGVVAIPSSVFYGAGDPDAGRTLVRWAFCKRTRSWRRRWHAWLVGWTGRSVSRRIFRPPRRRH